MDVALLTILDARTTLAVLKVTIVVKVSAKFYLSFHLYLSLYWH